MRLVCLMILSLSLTLFSCDKHSGVEFYGKWRIVEYKCVATSCPIGLSQVADGSDYSLEFDNQGNVICNTGCNLVSGQYIVRGNKLTFPEITSTEMACEDMLMEESVKHIFPNITSFDLSGNYLSLKNSEGQDLLKLVKF